MKKRFFVALLLLCCLCLTACSLHSAQQVGESVCFTDALGREVCVPKSPERVAALTGSFAEVWMLAGGSVCAAPQDAWEDFALPLSDAADLGGAHSPNTEVLLAQDPDFVIASASVASNVALCSLLESMHIPVAYFDVDCFGDYLQMLRVCTDITGREDLYRTNGLLIQEEIDAVRRAYADASVPIEERRILLLRVSSSSIKAKTSEGTVLGEMLKDIGCINIADGDTRLSEHLSIEEILVQDPYHIFAVAMGSDTEGASRALASMMEKDPAWGSLSAVKAGRIHMMDKKLFNLKPNVRWAKAYETLYETLMGT